MFPDGEALVYISSYGTGTLGPFMLRSCSKDAFIRLQVGVNLTAGSVENFSAQDDTAQREIPQLRRANQSVATYHVVKESWKTLWIGWLDEIEAFCLITQSVNKALIDITGGFPRRENSKLHE